MKVICNDDEVFEIDEDIIKQSTLLKQLSESESTDEPILLPDVKGSILTTIIEFCDYHKDDPEPAPNDNNDDPDKNSDEPKRSADISEWDRTFIQQFPVREGTLVPIVIAANYLGIKTLMNVGCRIIAEMIHEKRSSNKEPEMLNTVASSDDSKDEPLPDIDETEISETVVSDDSVVTTTEADSIDN